MDIVKDVIIFGVIVHWGIHAFAGIGLIATIRTFFRRKKRSA